MPYFGKKLSQSLVVFQKDTNGATAIEYGLIAALISVTLIVSIAAAGGSIETVFSITSSKLSAASNDVAG